MTDFQNFYRKLTLRLFFGDKQKSYMKSDEEGMNVKLQTKRRFDPNVSNVTLESFQQAVLGKVLEKWEGDLKLLGVS